MVQLCFGLFPLAVKMVHGEEATGLSPRALSAWRIAFGGVSLFTLALVLHGPRIWPARRDLSRLALCAFFGVVVNQLLALEGMVRSTVTNAGLLMTLIPVFTYGLAVLVRQEKPRLQRTLGIAVAMVGASLLILRDRGTAELSGRHLVGNFLIVSNCLSYAGYLILAGPLLGRMPPLVVIAWVFVLSFLALPLITWGEELLPAEPTASMWAWLTFILLFPTSLAYFLNTYALARVSASTTAVFIYLQPLVAGAAGVFVLKETLGITALLAAILLFLGIGLVVLRPSGRNRSSAPAWDEPAPQVRSSDEPVA